MPRPDGTAGAAGTRLSGEGARLALWGAGALSVALVHNRLWASPNLAFFTVISRSLGRNPFAGTAIDGSYLLTNLLPVAVARALGQTEPHAYARLHLAVLVVGLATVVAAVHRRFGYRPARLLCVFLAAAPATTIGMEWLGQPDAFTLPLALALVVARRRPTVAALAILLGLTHAEQGLVIAVVALLARIAIADADPRSSRRRLADAVPLVGGVAVGRLVVEGYLWASDIVVTTPRTAFFDRGIAEFARLHGEAGVWLVYALWGPLWLVVAGVPIAARRWPSAFDAAQRRGWALLATATAPPLFAMLATFDETRVYSLTAAPVLVAAAVLGAAALDAARDAAGATRSRHPARVLAAGAVGAVTLAALPAVFTVDGVHHSWQLPARSFARFLVDGEHPGELVVWLLDPLDYDIPSS